MNERELRVLRGIRDSLLAIQQEIRFVRDQQESQNTQEQTPSPAPVISAELQFPERIERNNQSNSDREYRIQKWLAFGTWLAFVAAAIYAGISKYQLGELKRQADSASAQIGIMQKQLEATDRPWLKVDAPQLALPLTFDADGVMHAHFSITVSNVGKSAATNVMLIAGIVIPKQGAELFTEPAKMQKEACDALQSSALAATIFPNDSKSPNIDINVPRSTVDERAIEQQPGPGKLLLPMVLYGCVDYHISSLAGHHQTGFAYMFGKRPETPENSPSWNLLGMIFVGRSLPVKDAAFKRWPLHGDYAN
jgi:hypothetical protein